MSATFFLCQPILFWQYDIRIWYEVYSAAIKQAKSEAKKERMRRRLYGDLTDNEQEDKELSLERIKRNVPLKRVINRRYREFMELHNRLTSGQLSVHMKGIDQNETNYLQFMYSKICVLHEVIIKD